MTSCKARMARYRKPDPRSYGIISGQREKPTNAQKVKQAIRPTCAHIRKG